ncbi:hypothetical protein HPB51_020788 [Rhipicephalus microplus]|uniref:BHLH domain-containing protein n=1 Tax=Rhipicephalus microplus TaxID=6941 RepID=A0A9J6DQ02_RHIMP|nr:hypothetical protein HPB51_020788 [Rhipicephalus microplus]
MFLKRNVEASPALATISGRRKNHSEIKKRRRDKMNMYISEMASLVPMFKAMSRKLGKLTELRQVVQHIKTIRGPINSYTEGHYKPPWLSEEDVKNVVLQEAKKEFGSPSSSTVLVEPGDRNGEMLTDSPEPRCCVVQVRVTSQSGHSRVWQVPCLLHR